jgi:polyphosphate kinase
MNALADPDIIRALYRASRRGVQIDLLVRGVCCLRPGVPGLSETIRVSSVVDRYLEHARIWGFHARGAEKLYLASGDWMQRDFVGRVDVAIPIDDPGLKDRLRREILGTMLADNVKARSLQPDGDSARGQAPAGEVRVRSQEQFSALARRAALVEAPQPLPAGGALLGGPRRSPRTRKRS